MVDDRVRFGPLVCALGAASLGVNRSGKVAGSNP
jgi:hypothetical protein